MKKQILVLGVAATLLMSSCKVGDFTLMTTKNVNVKSDKQKTEVKGWGFTIKEATDKAIKKGGDKANALQDGVILQSLFFGYTVKGTPIEIK